MHTHLHPARGLVYALGATLAWAGSIALPIAPASGAELCPETILGTVDSGSRFGHAVAIDGGLLLSGAYLGDEDDLPATGTAHVHRFRDGAWEQLATLISVESLPKDRVGFAVDLAGETAVVGAFRNDASALDAGAAYIFQADEDDPFVWHEVATLGAPAPAARDWFGYDVTIAGDVAAVGAFRDDGAGTDAGAVFLYGRDVGGPDHWGLITTIRAGGTAPGDWFGRAVALDADILVIGAPRSDVASTNAGAAYVFRRDAGGTDGWGEVARLTASDAAPGAALGADLAIDGTTVVAGAPGTNDSTGAAYVYRADAGGRDAWGEVARLAADDGSAGDLFGAVAIAGDTIAVGASRTGQAGMNTGSAYLFRRNGGGPDQWGQRLMLTAAEADVGQWYGAAAAIGGPHLVIGAPFYDEVGTYWTGAALIYRLPACLGCPADIDGSGGTDYLDLLSVITHWGPCPGCPEDVTGDGAVAFDDLLVVIATWGECP